MDKKPHEMDSAERPTVSAELAYDGVEARSHPVPAYGPTGKQFTDSLGVLCDPGGVLFFADLLLNEDTAPDAAPAPNTSGNRARDRALALLERAARLEVESGGAEIIDVRAFRPYLTLTDESNAEDREAHFAGLAAVFRDTATGRVFYADSNGCLYLRVRDEPAASIVLGGDVFELIVDDCRARVWRINGLSVDVLRQRIDEASRESSAVILNALRRASDAGSTAWRPRMVAQAASALTDTPTDPELKLAFEDAQGRGLYCHPRTGELYVNGPKGATSVEILGRTLSLEPADAYPGLFKILEFGIADLDHLR